MSSTESREGREATQTPRHGVRGEQATPPAFPASLTIAVSREAGSRGGTIARRVGRQLGWEVYNQELIDYIAQEGAFTEGVLANLPAEATQWAEQRLQALIHEGRVTPHPTVGDLARVLLALGAQGEVVLLGRGAGCILPAGPMTLNVRIIAPLADRVAYMSEWLRLTVEEAAEQVKLRDTRRAEFIQKHFHRQPADIYQYDLLLNSSLLGEDLCVKLIAQAARARLTASEGGRLKDEG